MDLFATGHENGTIKLWKIGDEQYLNSFESNLSVTCIVFNKTDNNKNDNLLISGNIGGGIKLYDLNENKVIRNYGGHRCEITDIDFFNFNNGTTLIVSCSTDSNVKIWDTRSKTNILTFKGHTNTVNCIDFSPDGNWIVSADCIGHTKLWDIKTSKCIHQFHDKQPINDVIFHPEELVLATASGKVVRFWDLETMKHISRTSKGTTPIKKILFPQRDDNDYTHHETDNDQREQYIISSSNQSLRIWQWDPLPVYCCNNISVHWNNKIGDMKQIKGYNDLICLELDKSRAVIWLTDLAQIFGNKHNIHNVNNIQQLNLQHDDNDIEQYYKAAPTPRTPMQNDYKENDEVSDGGDKDQDENDDDEDDTYEDEFEEIDDEDIPFDNNDAKKTSTKGESDESTYKDNVELKQDTEDMMETKGKNGNESFHVPDSLKNMPQEMWTQSFVDAVEIVRKQRKSKKRKTMPKKIKKVLPKLKQINESKPSPPKVAFIAKTELKRSPLKDEGDNDTTIAIINTDSNNDPTSCNLKLGQFIPRHLVDYDERELIKIKRTMMGEHIPILRMLSTRLRYLRQLKSLWKKKKLNEFMDILQQIQKDMECGNNTIFISFIQSILENKCKKSFSFRFCYLLLSVIDLDKLNILNENVKITILNYIHYFLETFSLFITDTLKTEIINEKDLNMMDRREYCQNALDLLTKDIQLFIMKIQNIDKENKHFNIKIDELCEKNLTLIDLFN